MAFHKADIPKLVDVLSGRGANSKASAKLPSDVIEELTVQDDKRFMFAMTRDRSLMSTQVSDYDRHHTTTFPLKMAKQKR